MIADCEGCRYELREAYLMQKRGYHVATTPSFSCSYPDNRRHYGLIIVDDDGNILMQ
jgi:hypothetical protein